MGAMAPDEVRRRSRVLNQKAFVVNFVANFVDSAGNRPLRSTKIATTWATQVEQFKPQRINDLEAEKFEVQTPRAERAA